MDCRHADFGISGWLFCLLSHSSLMNDDLLREFTDWHMLRDVATSESPNNLEDSTSSVTLFLSKCVDDVDENVLFVFHVFCRIFAVWTVYLLCSCVFTQPAFLLLLPCICLISPLATLSIGCLDLSRVPNITSSQFLHQGSWPLSCVLLHQRSPLLYMGLLMPLLFLHLAMFHLFLSWYRLYFMCFLGFCGVCIFDVSHLCSYDSTPAPALTMRVN